MSTSTWTENPSRSDPSASLPGSIAILTGRRWTIFTQFPVAFSAGRSAKAAPVPALMLSTRPRYSRSGFTSVRKTAGWPTLMRVSSVSLKFASTQTWSPFSGTTAQRGWPGATTCPAARSAC